MKTSIIKNESPLLSLVQSIFHFLNSENKILRKVVRSKEEEICKLKELAFKDPLTEIDNLRSVKEKLSAPVSYHGAFIDLNDFKPINDTYGHCSGDEVLQEVANRLKRFIQKDELCARVGGDEFLLLLTRPIDKEDLKNAIFQIPFQTNKGFISVTGSIGVGDVRKMSDINAIDQEMYADKFEYKMRKRKPVI